MAREGTQRHLTPVDEVHQCGGDRSGSGVVHHRGPTVVADVRGEPAWRTGERPGDPGVPLRAVRDGDLQDVPLHGLPRRLGDDEDVDLGPVPGERDAEGQARGLTRGDEVARVAVRGQQLHPEVVGPVRPDTDTARHHQVLHR
jgi:hypothetical protein